MGLKALMSSSTQTAADAPAPPLRLVETVRLLALDSQALGWLLEADIRSQAEGGNAVG